MHSFLNGVFAVDRAYRDNLKFILILVIRLVKIRKFHSAGSAILVPEVKHDSFLGFE